MTKIDVFPHCLPRAYFERAIQRSPAGATLQKRMTGIPVLVDVELRLRIMDRYAGYVQVLTLANPPIEVIADARTSPELARLANDGMAEIVAKHPDRFPAFVASLPMNNPEAAVAEIDRAVDGLGATGVQIYTNVAGRPLDLAEYQPGFARMAQRDRPIWLRPPPPGRAPPTCPPGGPACRGTSRCSRAWPSATCRSGCTRRGRPGSRITRARRARSTTSGGRSAGRTRRRRPWPGWSSPDSSTATPTSRSSPTTWAR